MRTRNIPSCYRKSKRSRLCLLTKPVINPHWLELPLSRINFHGPKGVRAIEVLLYFGKGCKQQVIKVVIFVKIAGKHEGLPIRLNFRT